MLRKVNPVDVHRNIYKKSKDTQPTHPHSPYVTMD